MSCRKIPNRSQALASVRAVTRQETTALVVDAKLYHANLSRVDSTDAHAAVCRDVSYQIYLDYVVHVRLGVILR